VSELALGHSCTYYSRIQASSPTAAILFIVHSADVEICTATGAQSVSAFQDSVLCSKRIIKAPKKKKKEEEDEEKEKKKEGEKEE
jgi:uncharacterized membrane protein YdbT with pleckstrin-like domain